MPSIRWSNGMVDKAGTWQEILDHVRATQWFDMPEDEFRAVLATRALRWSKTIVDPSLPARDLFFALEEAKLVEILTATEADEEPV